MDIILYNIGLAILITILGYFIGAIPNGIWIGRLFFHKDPRDYGSGNSGATNVGRIFGMKIGALCIFLDAVKVILPIYLIWLFMVKVPMYNNLPLMADIHTKYTVGDANYLVRWPMYWMVTVGASIGHCYPIYEHFKGGKNVSTFFGSLLGSSWLLGIPAVIFFVIVLKIKKYVSLSSILSSWFGAILSWIWAILMLTVIPVDLIGLATYGLCLELNWVFAICITFSALLLTLRHWQNIKRIRSGEERKIKWMK